MRETLTLFFDGSFDGLFWVVKKDWMISLRRQRMFCKGDWYDTYMDFRLMFTDL